MRPFTNQALPVITSNQNQTAMKITLFQTAAALDPNQTTANPDASLANYVSAVTAAIHKEFPEAEVEHINQDNTYAHRVSGVDDGAEYEQIGEAVQRIAEDVYATGLFWE